MAIFNSFLYVYQRINMAKGKNKRFSTASLIPGGHEAWMCFQTLAICYLPDIPAPSMANLGYTQKLTLFSHVFTLFQQQIRFSFSLEFQKIWKSPMASHDPSFVHQWPQGPWSQCCERIAAESPNFGVASALHPTPAAFGRSLGLQGKTSRPSPWCSPILT